MKKIARKAVSVLLTILMALSVFNGLTFTASVAGVSYVDENGETQTCTGDLVCTVCGNIVETGTVIPATGEEPTEPEKPTEPSGETEGYVCSYCGQVHTKDLTGWVICILHTLIYLLQSITPLVSQFAAQ